MPDLRGLDMPLEKFMFFLQHVMLVLLPMVWVAQRRFHLYKVRRRSRCPARLLGFSRGLAFTFSARALCGAPRLTSAG
jgi:hypothetical protein